MESWWYMAIVVGGPLNALLEWAFRRVERKKPHMRKTLLRARIAIVLAAASAAAGVWLWLTWGISDGSNTGCQIEYDRQGAYCR